MCKMIAAVVFLGATLGLVGCDAPPATHSGHSVSAHALQVHTYREKHPRPPASSSQDTTGAIDPSWYYVYWYVINDTDRARTSYYYRSSSPVTNFSSVTFTRSPGGLPKAVEEELEQAEPTEEVELAATQEPAQVQADEAAEAGQSSGMESPTDSAPAPAESTATESTSTDSGADGGAGSSD